MHPWQEAELSARVGRHGHHACHAPAGLEMQGRLVRPVRSSGRHPRSDGEPKRGPPIAEREETQGGWVVILTDNVVTRGVGQGKGRLGGDLSVGAGCGSYFAPPFAS